MARTAREQLEILSKCHLKLGTWQMAVEGALTEELIKPVLDSFELARHYADDSYKCWHAWAMANLEVVSFYQSQKTADARVNTTIINALRAFFKSIALSRDNSLQDTLRLITLWFNNGHQPEVSLAMEQGFATVPLDTWLQVIPQLIARINASSFHVRRLIHSFLLELGGHHLQALLYYLTFPSRSDSLAQILNRMRKHNANLVEQVRANIPQSYSRQALLVSMEMNRVAVLWHEIWHEGLEEASRAYITDKNPQAMLNILEPLHAMLAKVCTIRFAALQTTLGSGDIKRGQLLPSLWPRLAGGGGVVQPIPEVTEHH